MGYVNKICVSSIPDPNDEEQSIQTTHLIEPTLYFDTTYNSSNNNYSLSNKGDFVPVNGVVIQIKINNTTTNSIENPKLETYNIESIGTISPNTNIIYNLLYKEENETGKWYVIDNSVSCIGISSTNNDHEYPILLKHSSNTDNETNVVNFINDATNKITVNPSTGTITAKQFSGAFSGDGTNLTNLTLTTANGTTAGVVSCSTAANNIDITNLLECPIKDGKVYYTDTNTHKYHTSGNWSGFKYTATAVNGADELSFTLQTGTGANQVAVGNHTHSNYLTSAALDAYVKIAGSTMTGNLTCKKSSPSVAIEASSSGVRAYLFANSTGTNHGLYSNGYSTDGSTLTSSGKWMVYRDSSGDVYLQGNATSATSATNDADGNEISATYFKQSGGQIKGNVFIMDNDLVKGTAPSETTSTRCIYFQDKNNTTGGTRAGTIGTWVTSSKVVSTRIYAYAWTKDSTTNGYFAAGYNTADSVARTYTNCKVYGAVWNDYAEYRQGDIIEGGYCVTETPSGVMTKSTERLQPGCRVTSDTFGFAIGETKECKTPIAVSGRVLVYTARPREEFPLGAAVCSAPDGKVDLMTREEIKEYPERIIGTVSEIPNYEIWYGGNSGLPEEETPTPVTVNGRIWIYIK